MGADLRDIGIWLHVDRETAGRRTQQRAEPAPLPVFPGSRNVVVRDVPPMLARVAASGLSVEPGRGTQVMFQTSARLEAVEAFYTAELSRRGMNVVREDMSAMRGAMIQLVGRSSEGLALIKAEAEEGRSVVSATIFGTERPRR